MFNFINNIFKVDKTMANKKLTKTEKIRNLFSKG